MSNKESQVKYEAWITEYLYSELDDEQKEAFERALTSDTQLKKTYEAHIGLDSILAKSSRPYIGEQRMQGVRWAAMRGVRRGRQQSSWGDYIADLWRIQVPIKVQMVSMAMMFVAGFFISGITEKPVQTEEVSTGILSFVGDGDYQIVDMALDEYDKTKGEVQVSFALASQSQVRGNLSNPQIRDLLTQSLRNESNDDIRLQLIDLFGGYSHKLDVKEVLAHTLLNDPNPGVRYSAAEHLIKMPDDDLIRRTLEHALVNDVNPGVRVEAFLKLTENIDNRLLEILGQHCIDDANTFIRQRSRNILNDYLIEGVRGNTLTSI